MRFCSRARWCLAATLVLAIVGPAWAVTVMPSVISRASSLPAGAHEASVEPSWPEPRSSSSSYPTSSSSSSLAPPLQFSEPEAEQFVRFAYAAYCPQASLASWTCTWCNATGFSATQFFNAPSDGGFGYAGYDSASDTIVVVFRGTVMDSLGNWISDLTSIELEPATSYCTNCSVADGFMTAYLELRDQVITGYGELREANPHASLIVAGHSLGAALATYAAVDLYKLYGVTPALQTFGCPRTGNLAFAQFVNEVVTARTRSMRMVWLADIVPHLPPMEAGFNHYNTEVWMSTQTGEFVTCNERPFGEDPKCADSLSVVSFSVEDHLQYMNLYEDCGQA